MMGCPKCLPKMTSGQENLVPAYFNHLSQKIVDRRFWTDLAAMKIDKEADRDNRKITVFVDSASLDLFELARSLATQRLSQEDQHVEQDSCPKHISIE